MSESGTLGTHLRVGAWAKPFRQTLACRRIGSLQPVLLMTSLVVSWTPHRGLFDLKLGR